MSNHVSRPVPDLICFSHLRWNFVFQRPQHLMSRFARERRVFFFEEPIREDDATPKLTVEQCPQTGVYVATPIVDRSLSPADANAAVARLVRKMFRDHAIEKHVQWYYTPMALEYVPPSKALAVVYDCMDELSLFHNAPPALRRNEQELFRICDLVFTGGISLFEAKRLQHPRVYAFPSSVDSHHFAQARSLADTAADQCRLPRPRLGYAGVIDERIDMALLTEIAEQRPEWHFVMLGPVVKIDPGSLPRLPNIHWLGAKPYSELPRYMAGWDVALMPFALNDATRFISPTKTPEYLAAGLPVVSTPIHDVVRQYGQRGMARIASGPAEFLAGIEDALTHGTSLKKRHLTDAYVRTLSWDITWQAMDRLIREMSAAKTTAALPEVPKTMTAASQAGASYT